MRHTSFTFKVRPSACTAEKLRQHAGARRFAYNFCVALVRDTGRKRQKDSQHKGPVSGFDLINAFNQWKLSPEAGVDDSGNPGLAWRSSISAQVLEEGAVDAGRALTRFFQRCKKAKTSGIPNTVGLPRFKKKGRDKASFRMRNKRDCIKLKSDTLQLPNIGELPLSGSTRKLRRLLRQDNAASAARAKICFATVFETAGKWYVRINVEAESFHPARMAPQQTPVIGLDLGLHALAVAAHADGSEKARWKPTGAAKHTQDALTYLSRRYAKKKRGSRNCRRARRRITLLHQRIADIRRATLHEITCNLTKNHSHVAVEDLHIAGMLKNRCLARSISDAGWGILSQQLAYKGAWYHCKITTVNRFYPSSKTCCRCDWKAASMPLSERVFQCEDCGWEADRDTNAAANLARWAEQAVLAPKVSAGAAHPAASVIAHRKRRRSRSIRTVGPAVHSAAAHEC